MSDICIYPYMSVRIRVYIWLSSSGNVTVPIFLQRTCYNCNFALLCVLEVCLSTKYKHHEDMGHACTYAHNRPIAKH